MMAKLTQLSDALNSLSTRERIVLLLLVSTIIFGLYDYFTLAPYTEQRQQHQAMIAQYTSDISNTQHATG